MREALIQMKPNRLEDIIALVALYRPGPMSNISIYNDCKHKKREPDYLHQKIKNIRPIQGAALHLTDKETLIALNILFESISYIKSWLKSDKVTIVYLPSPISTYEWEEPIIFFYGNYYKGKKNTTNKENNQKSLMIRNQIKEFSKINNIEFLDTTDYLYEKGKNTVLHGPLDWGHFNYDGYKNISNYIIRNRSVK